MSKGGQEIPPPFGVVPIRDGSGTIPELDDFADSPHDGETTADHRGELERAGGIKRDPGEINASRTAAGGECQTGHQGQETKREQSLKHVFTPFL